MQDRVLTIDRALTVDGAASLLGISFDEMFDLILAGKVPYYKGYNSYLGYLFFESELIEWKIEKLKDQSAWIDETLTHALYDGKPSHIVDLISVDVAERYLDIINKKALMR